MNHERRGSQPDPIPRSAAMNHERRGHTIPVQFFGVPGVWRFDLRTGA